MKRYKLIGPKNEITQLSECVMIKDPDGEWVGYEDVEGLLQYIEYKNRLKGCKLESDSCNCLKNCVKPSGVPMAQGMIKMLAWFCPAHGYKKL